jgi:glycerate dehydrogenase
VGLHDQAVKAGEWSRNPDWSFWKTPLIELRGKIMGIVGFGRIGRRAGELAHALGMEVLAHDPHPGREPGYEPFGWASLEEVFTKADVVSLHSPQTEANTGFVKADLLKLMKPTAFLINTARGGLVNEADLAQALDQGRLAGAALDVVSAEPISADNPLLGAKNIIITPHLAWAAKEARERLMVSLAENIRAFQTGRPINVVNQDHLKKAES